MSTQDQWPSSKAVKRNHWLADSNKVGILNVNISRETVVFIDKRSVKIRFQLYFGDAFCRFQWPCV